MLVSSPTVLSLGVLNLCNIEFGNVEFGSVEFKSAESWKFSEIEISMKFYEIGISFCTISKTKFS